MENTMFNESVCAFCHNNHRNLQYGWGHTNECILIQTILKVVEDILRRNGNIGAPYPRDPMDMGNHYIHPFTYPLMGSPSTFNAEYSFGENGMDALTTHMENTYLTLPADIADSWPAHGSASTSMQGVGSSPGYDALAASPEGYVGALQDAVPDDGDTRYAEQDVVEPPFVPTSPSPILSIPAFEHLAQGTYRGKVSVKGTPAGPVYFNDSEGQGVTSRSLATLANGNEPAFDAAADIGRKASIRLKLPHFSEPSGQIIVRHGDQRREGRPITLRELGGTVFDTLRKLMDQAERCGCPLRHGGSVVDIERVVLLRVDHVSKGSIQPILGIRNTR